MDELQGIVRFTFHAAMVERLARRRHSSGQARRDALRVSAATVSGSPME